MFNTGRPHPVVKTFTLSYTIFDIIYYTQDRGSVSSRYPNTKKRVENTTCSGVFLMKNWRCLESR